MATTFVSGGVVTNQSVAGGDTEEVEATGIAIGTNVSADGTQLVDNGGLVGNTSVAGNGALQEIASGGIAANTSVTNGGEEKIDQGGTAGNTTVNGGTLVVNGTLSGASISNGSAQVGATGTITNATLVTNATLTLATGASATGTTINAGTSLIVNAGATSVNTTLDNGTLDVGASGLSGSLNLAGGLVDVTSNLTTAVTTTLAAGTTSTLNLNGFTADFTSGITGTGTLDITGTGTFTGSITGSDVNNDYINELGTTTTLTLDNATTSGNGLYITGGTLDSVGTNNIYYLALGEGTGNAATANIASGTLTIGTTVTDAQGVLHGALQIGDFGGTGTFDQTGGLVNIEGSLNIGNQGGTGTYNLSGGTLEMTQSAGLYDLGRATTNHPGSQGTLNISGTGLLDLKAGDMIIGSRDTSSAGTGLITQTGGTLEIEAGAQLFLSGTGAGEYDLDGGALEVGGNGLVANYNGSGGSSTFMLGGGTIDVTGSKLVTGVNATLVAGTTSTLNVGSLGAELTGTLSGSGTLDITGTGVTTLTGVNSSFTGDISLASGTLELANSQAAGTGTITFAPQVDPTLKIDGTTMPTAAISGFGAGDDIDLVNIANQSGSSADFNYTTHVLTITEGASTYTLNFDPNENFTGEYFHLNPDAANTGTDVTESGIACYCHGTRILTDKGEASVETLAIGDHVVTASGQIRPIKWIGRRSYGGRFMLGRKDILPVCVKAGAIADNVPKRDLWISPHHAMFIDGVLIEGKDLINGISIVQAEHVESVDYYHVELDGHDVILAEGAWSETFVDDDSRSMFHNAHEFAARYPDTESTLAVYYAPRVEEGAVLDAVQRNIARRAGFDVVSPDKIGGLRGHLDYADHGLIHGWAQSLEHPSVPVCLDILIDGVLIAQTLASRYREDLAVAGVGSGHHGFLIKLPIELSPDVAHVIEVRRSADGAGLSQSPCQLEQRRFVA